MIGGRRPGEATAAVPWPRLRRILAVRLDNVGDVIMLGPALRALRAALPAALVTLMASPAGAQAAPLLPWVDDVLVHRALWQDASGALAFDPGAEEALITQLRAGRFDAALVFTSFSQSPYPPAYACYLAGIPVRIGQARDFGGGMLSTWVTPLADATHQVDRNLHLLEACGLEPGGRALELRVPPAAAATVARLLEEAGVDPGEPCVVLAPVASCPARTYPAERFATVAAALGERGVPVVVVGREAERAAAQPVLAAPARRPVADLVGRTTVPELAALVARASVVLTNNSSALHLADAFGRPAVVLYAGTDLESQWRPRRAPAVLLRRPVPCAPCYGFRCPFGLECLDVAPAEVVATALGLLGAARATASGERPPAARARRRCLPRRS